MTELFFLWFSELVDTCLNAFVAVVGAVMALRIMGVEL